MSLTEKYNSPFSFLLPFNPKKKTPGADIYKPFEQILITRLSDLLSVIDSKPYAPFHWLPRSIDLLTLTLTNAISIISDPSLCDTDRSALSSHLDSSVALLDACNAITAAADRILHGRLHVHLAIHLISSFPSLSPDRLLRASSAIAEWEVAIIAPTSPSDCKHLSRLRSKNLNRGKLSAVRRTIYAIEAISDLVVRSTLVALGQMRGSLSGICISSEFPWANVYAEIVTKISANLCCGEGLASEIEVTKASVRKLVVAVDKNEAGERVTEELRDAVEGAEKTIGELTDGMDRLTNAVSGLFRAALETREASLDCFRTGPLYCK